MTRDSVFFFSRSLSLSCSTSVTLLVIVSINSAHDVTTIRINAVTHAASTDAAAVEVVVALTIRTPTASTDITILFL